MAYIALTLEIQMILQATSKRFIYNILIVNQLSNEQHQGKTDYFPQPIYHALLCLTAFILPTLCT
jgi:hypothetical protein